MTEKGRKRKNRSGPGRPPVFDDPVYTAFWMEREDKERLYEQKGTLPVGVYVGMLLRSKNAEKAVLMRKLAEKDKVIEEKDRRIEELEKLVERLEERIRKLELELEKAKGERPARTYEEGKLLRTLAEHAREGVSWADLCAEVLDLRDEKKMKRLMQLAFNVKTTGRNTYATEFYPKRTAPEFKGWVLKRPEREGPVLLIDYELYRGDTLKAAKGLAVGEAVAEKVPEVKPLKSGPAAERWIEITLEVIYHEYMQFIETRQGKKAKEFIEVEAQSRIERTLEAVDPADARRAAFAVLEKHEADWNEAFISNMRRVLTRILNTGHYARPLEVKADVPVEACDL